MKIPTTCMVPAMHTHIIIYREVYKTVHEMRTRYPHQVCMIKKYTKYPPEMRIPLLIYQEGVLRKWCSFLRLLVWHCSMWLVSRSQTLSQGKGGGGRGGRESGKVLYIELSQRLVWGATNQIASLWHYIVCGGISDCERRINTRAQ